ncbi:hypothetical protein PC116_g11519 [Phytophthora cactorum]|uniref:Uncharacterized protein n=1 Tax=Phytophthora cactorum TaxID=29920 RepID=A0A8T1KYT4_9STRA|nr:hypothetical protein PC117_g16058 [Phytophthora cactorum]KAG3011912.1 hypothetical protein PC120_g14155 [Phytophthora cactorum]KAG3200707.1 hypothetical protein PC128_g4431 [Phytophthora cactorum]KAG4049895.1 hypothetical protein PC123_g14846 [Phytophthora cactorum]KAG4240532.1 hypothetical protein PC116_g11519 [Phytophthora cactorum]
MRSVARQYVYVCNRWHASAVFSATVASSSSTRSYSCNVVIGNLSSVLRRPPHIEAPADAAAVNLFATVAQEHVSTLHMCLQRLNPGRYRRRVVSGLQSCQTRRGTENPRT